MKINNVVCLNSQQLKTLREMISAAARDKISRIDDQIIPLPERLKAAQKEISKWNSRERAKKERRRKPIDRRSDKLRAEILFMDPTKALALVKKFVKS